MLDVEQSPELQAALLALRVMNRDLAKEIAQEARPGLSALWQQGLSRQAVTAQDQALVPGARVAVTDRRIRAQAGTSRKALSGGLVPAVDYGPLEWGAKPRLAKVHGRSRKGKAYEYERTINSGFRGHDRKGHVAMRAAGDLGPAIVSGWVQLIVGKLVGVFDVSR